MAMSFNLGGIFSRVATTMGASAAFSHRGEIYAVQMTEISDSALAASLKTDFGSRFSSGQGLDFFARLHRGQLDGLAVKAKPLQADAREDQREDQNARQADAETILAGLTTQLGADCCFVQKKQLYTISATQVSLDVFLSALSGAQRERLIQAYASEQVDYVPRRIQKLMDRHPDILDHLTGARVPARPHKKGQPKIDKKKADFPLQTVRLYRSPLPLRDITKRISKRRFRQAVQTLFAATVMPRNSKFYLIAEPRVGRDKYIVSLSNRPLQDLHQSWTLQVPIGVDDRGRFFVYIDESEGPNDLRLIEAIFLNRNWDLHADSIHHTLVLPPSLPHERSVADLLYNRIAEASRQRHVDIQDQARIVEFLPRHTSIKKYFAPRCFELWPEKVSQVLGGRDPLPGERVVLFTRNFPRTRGRFTGPVQLANALPRLGSAESSYVVLWATWLADRWWLSFAESHGNNHVILLTDLLTHPQSLFSWDGTRPAAYRMKQPPSKAAWKKFLKQMTGTTK